MSNKMETEERFFKIYVNCDRCQISYDSDRFEGEDCHNCTESKCGGYLCLACIEDGKYVCQKCIDKGFKDTSFDVEMRVEIEDEKYEDEEDDDFGYEEDDEFE